MRTTARGRRCGERLGREVVSGEAMLEAQARASFDFWLAHLDRVAGA